MSNPQSSGPLNWVDIEKLLATPYVDSTTALGANATFTGTTRNLQASTVTSPFVVYYAGIRVIVTANVAGTLYIDESPDGNTWLQGAASGAVSAGAVVTLSYKAVNGYVRVRYVNGSTAQTSFGLYSRIVGDIP
jgi:hypothetical protein